jgi:hypothetical protein
VLGQIRMVNLLVGALYALFATTLALAFGTITWQLIGQARVRAEARRRYASR